MSKTAQVQSNQNQTDNQSKCTVLNLSGRLDDPSKESRIKLFHIVKCCWKKNYRIKFIITAFGIFISYLCVGILQEKIMKSHYGDQINADGTKGEKFTYANTLAAVSLLSGFIFIGVWSLFKPHKKDETSFGYYMVAAIVNNLSMVTAYAALKWVSFPTQTILKCGKPISVMLFGWLICKRYPIQRYFFVFLVVIGVIVFNLNEPKEDGFKAKPENSLKTGPTTDVNELLGISLLIFSLAMDGVLGMIQDKIRAAHSPTFQQMMLSMSGFGGVILLIILVVTHEIVDVFNFTCRHIEVLWHMAIFGLAGAVGQIFIYTMVSQFGALASSITTTVRKFFSVICSIIVFGHPSTIIQWSGAALLFSALLADAFFGHKKQLSNRENETNEKPTNFTDPKLPVENVNV